MLLVRNQVSKPADDFDFHFVTLLKLFFYLLFFFFFGISLWIEVHLHGHPVSKFTMLQYEYDLTVNSYSY